MLFQKAAPLLLLQIAAQLGRHLLVSDPSIRSAHNDNYARRNYLFYYRLSPSPWPAQATVSKQLVLSRFSHNQGEHHHHHHVHLSRLPGAQLVPFQLLFLTCAAF